MYVCMYVTARWTNLLSSYFLKLLLSKAFKILITVDQGYLYRNINILFYYHIRHSNMKKYNRELELTFRIKFRTPLEI